MVVSLKVVIGFKPQNALLLRRVTVFCESLLVKQQGCKVGVFWTKMHPKNANINGWFCTA
jgi:hypothetical protein